MTDRVLPTPEKFASCPYDGKVLPFYEGQFDCVYVLLHPFCKPTSIDIERLISSDFVHQSGLTSMKSFMSVMPLAGKKF